MSIKQKKKLTFSANERLIVGRNAVGEIIKNKMRQIRKLYCTQEIKQEPLLSEFPHLQGMAININKGELTRVSQTENHQGIAVIVESDCEVTLNEFLSQNVESARLTIVALDEVSDPHNLGAIFRAAECFGVDALLWSSNRGVGKTAVCAKVSAGASELVVSIMVANLAQALSKLKEAGFWVVGASVGEGAVNIDGFGFPEKVVILLGAEGDGIRQIHRQLCDYFVHIPMRGKVDSLNVSQAASVFFYARNRDNG